MPHANGFQQFLVLLYKGALLRKRHYVVTFFEVVIPVLLASIPAIIQSEVGVVTDYRPDSSSSRQSLWVNYTTYAPFDPYTTKSHSQYDLQFVYAPNNTHTNKFMEDAILKFKEKSQYRGTITWKATNNGRELEAYCVYMQKMKQNNLFIGTILSNFEKDIPSSLDYTIRYGGYYIGSFNTRMKYRVNGPSYSNVYIDSFFLGWQTAVEQTFIQERTPKGKERDFKVYMQRFPYPDHLDTSKALSIITMVPWVIGYGYLIFIINIVRRVIEEKTNGSKELLKMMGMSDGVYWISTFTNYFSVALVTTLIISIVYKAPLKNSIVLMAGTNFILLFVLLALFMASLILFCMALSIFFNRGVFAVIVLMILYIVSFSMLMSYYFLLNTELAYFSLSTAQKFCICLIPPGSLLTMFYLISYFEATGEGAHWHNLSEYNLVPDLNLGMVMGAMVLSCVIYSILIWYCDAVWPWQPGVPKPFYFLFTRSYWCGANYKENGDKLLAPDADNSSDFFEDEPTGTTPGVVIKNLSKEFRTGLQRKMAVKNLSLNLYQGQITALLGHNGAGKTTTINILTGLYTPSSGTASINGMDILSETTRARRGLGVCPQHNVLYDTLTVDEHLRIYAAMKGVSWGKLAAESEEVLKILHLLDKRYELVKTLSGGMKRKLSLAIAIVGGSKVLFLDEPTSGMDVEARRSVWDSLLEIRHDRTIVLTTHYMEEADILGDRIAIMAEGEVQCSGSPMFLKQKFGTGYHLHVVKDRNFDLNGLLSILTRSIPEASVGNELEQEISFNLSSNTSEQFADMFEEIETNKEKVGVMSYGITITTMEDVFLNVANIADMKYKLQSGSEQNNGTNVEFEDVYGETRSGTLQHDFGLQLSALLIKRFHYTTRHWSNIISQVVLPFLLMIMCLRIISSASSENSDDKALRIDINGIYGKTDSFFYTKSEPSDIAAKYQTVLGDNNINYIKAVEPTHYVLDYGKKDITRYLKSFLVGAAFDEFSNKTQNFTAWYNGEPYHAPPMAVLFMHTAILRSVTGTGSSITLTNDPLPEPTNYHRGDNNDMNARILGSVFVPLALGYLAASFALVPVHERVSKAKLLQLMSGVWAATYWLSMFLWDFMVYIFVSILLIIPFGIFSGYAFFGMHSNAIGSVLLLMIAYGWASIPLSYLVSFLFKKPNTAFSLIVGISSIIGVGFGTGMRIVQWTLSTQAHYSSKELDFFFWPLRIFPPFCASVGFSNLFGNAYSNAICESVSKEDLDFNCESPSMSKYSPFFQCCKDSCKDDCLVQTELLNMSVDGSGRDLLFLLFDGVLYVSLLLLVESSFMAAFGREIKRSFQRLRNRIIQHYMQDIGNQDSEVIAEEERVRNITEVGRVNSESEALLVVNLAKVYKNFYAVDHLTFGIHQEECFGLLGVNGAGKTTTFRMLTGDCHPTEGNAFIQGCSVVANLKKFQSYLGYCPQFDALIDKLTGREMLQLFARLRGLRGEVMEERVNKMIRMTDLTAHADKQTRLYSGGNKRKLSVGISLIGAPPLLLLDEPTAGVDPVSRRKIWNILSQARNKTGAAVILTTHSMEESEALCSRLAIMVNGRFKCLGSIQQLKSKYGQGYTLIIKLKREAQNDPRSMVDIKEHINEKIPGATLKDDHQGMLQYHIVHPKVTLGSLFRTMSDMKSTFDLEDYLVSDTSLEQIFLTFARSQRITA